MSRDKTDAQSADEAARYLADVVENDPQVDAPKRPGGARKVLMCAFFAAIAGAGYALGTAQDSNAPAPSDIQQLEQYDQQLEDAADQLEQMNEKLKRIREQRSDLGDKSFAREIEASLAELGHDVEVGFGAAHAGAQPRDCCLVDASYGGASFADPWEGGKLLHLASAGMSVDAQDIVSGKSAIEALGMLEQSQGYTMTFMTQENAVERFGDNAFTQNDGHPMAVVTNAEGEVGSPTTAAIYYFTDDGVKPLYIHDNLLYGSADDLQQKVAPYGYEVQELPQSLESGGLGHAASAYMTFMNNAQDNKPDLAPDHTATLSLADKGGFWVVKAPDGTVSNPDGPAVRALDFQGEVTKDLHMEDGELKPMPTQRNAPSYSGPELRGA